MSYERRAGRRLASEVLMADSHHTQSDLLTSLTVIAALVGVSYGMPLLESDGGHHRRRVHRPRLLGHLPGHRPHPFGSELVIAEDDIRRNNVKASARSPRLPPTSVHAARPIMCSSICTSGSTPGCSSRTAHRLSHVVKDRIMARYPQVKDAVIHIEPPREARRSSRKVPTSGDVTLVS